MTLLTRKIGVATGKGSAFSVPILVVIAIAVLAITAYRRASTPRTCAL